MFHHIRHCQQVSHCFQDRRKGGKKKKKKEEEKNRTEEVNRLLGTLTRESLDPPLDCWDPEFLLSCRWTLKRTASQPSCSPGVGKSTEGG